MKLTSLLLLLFTFLTFSYGKEYKLIQSDTTKSLHNYGLFFHLGKNYYKPKFQDLDEVASCCPEFQSGEGMGINFGGIYEYEFSKIVSFGSRLGYYALNGELSALQSQLVNIDGKSVKGLFVHQLSTDLSYLSLEPLANFNLLNNFSVHTGFVAGFYSILSNYEHFEKIIEPSAGTFENGKRTRLVNDGILEKTSDFVFAFSLGISYKFPLDKKNAFTGNLELFFNPYLTDLYETRYWKADVLRLGLAVKYNPVEIIDLYEEIPEIIPDKIVKIEKTYHIEADILAKATDKFNREYDVEEVLVEQNLSNDFRPLLPYIFFAENNYTLDDKYSKLTTIETEKFNLAQIKKLSVIETYYHLLNIVGFRMKMFPDSKIILEGSNDGNNEKNNIELSENRAITVRNYLENVWDIERKRMTIKYRNLPSNYSNTDHSDGNEENRRVEIIPDNWNIIAPIEINDTLTTITPSIIHYYPSIKSDTTIKDGTISIESSKKKRINYSEFQNKNFYVWKPDLTDFVSSPEHIFYKIDAENIIGQNANSDKKKMKVIYKTISKKIRNIENGKFVDRYMLVYFQFDKFRLSEVNSNIIRMIKEKLDDDSEIFVTGYTDRTGTEEHNLRLSTERASTVSEFFINNNVKYEGFGIDLNTFNNDTPEGRFYSRRVDIRIETPMK